MEQPVPREGETMKRKWTIGFLNETGFGAPGRNTAANNEKVGAGTDYYIPSNLSLFGHVVFGPAGTPHVHQTGAESERRPGKSTVVWATRDTYPLNNSPVARFCGPER
jgi:hypothetical protein